MEIEKARLMVWWIDDLISIINMPPASGFIINEYVYTPVTHPSDSINRLRIFYTPLVHFIPFETLYVAGKLKALWISRHLGIPLDT